MAPSRLKIGTKNVCWKQVWKISEFFQNTGKKNSDVALAEQTRIFLKESRTKKEKKPSWNQINQFHEYFPNNIKFLTFVWNWFIISFQELFFGMDFLRFFGQLCHMTFTYLKFWQKIFFWFSWRFFFINCRSQWRGRRS